MRSIKHGWVNGAFCSIAVRAHTAYRFLLEVHFSKQKQKKMRTYAIE
jgi:hypothetical protein